MGGLLVLKAAAERVRVAGLVLLDAETPGRPAARRPGPTSCATCRPSTGATSVIGWETLPEKLQRENRDLTLDDVLRIQHLLGQKPHESGRARAAMLAGVRVEPDLLEGVPTLVIGSGVDGAESALAPERLADWLGAEHEQSSAPHSHYGLVLAEESSRQVADRVRVFLEAHRLLGRRAARRALVRVWRASGILLRRSRDLPVGRRAAFV